MLTKVVTQAASSRTRTWGTRNTRQLILERHFPDKVEWSAFLLMCRCSTSYSESIVTAGSSSADPGVMNGQRAVMSGHHRFERRFTLAHAWTPERKVCFV